MLGDNTTCLHLAADYDAYNIIEHVLQYIIKHFPAKFTNIVNLQDKESQTPAKIALMKDHFSSFSKFFEYNACDFILKDREENDLKNLLENAPTCKAYLDKYIQPSNLMPGVENPNEKEENFSRLKKLVADNSDPRIKFVPMSSKVYPILKSCIETRKVYTDTEFPAVLDSITKDKNHRLYKTKFTPSKWLRPHEFLETNYSKIKVFDTVEPNDIVQGCLGTCYFLASLASITEYPSRLMECFLTKNINDFGVYSIMLYIYGVPTEVIIDDKIPCLNKIPLFAKCKGNEIWVVLLDKAWAKIFKHYTVAEIGHAGWSMSCLTKAPAFSYYVTDSTLEDLFKTVMDADQKNWIMTTICGFDDTEKKQEVGLVSGHIYSLLGAYDFGEVKLFKLRNPWGRGEFKGAYSDTSTKWTPEMKKKVGLVVANDGVFFINIQDFKLYFETINICQYQDNWFYTYDSIDQKAHHATYHEFEVTENTSASFRVHQPDLKTYVDDQPDYKVSKAEITVCLFLPDGTLQDIVPKSKKSYVNDNYGVNYLQKDKKSVLLKPGKYLIRSKINWFDDKEKPCTVSVYSSRKINIVRRTTKFENYFEKVCINMAKKEEKTTIMEGVSISRGYFRNDLYYFYATNQGQKTVDIYWTIQKEINKFKIKKTPNKVYDNSFKVILAPGESKIAAVVLQVDYYQFKPHFDLKNSHVAKFI